MASEMEQLGAIYPVGPEYLVACAAPGSIFVEQCAKGSSRIVGEVLG
jgi:hypothetical protein